MVALIISILVLLPSISYVTTALASNFESRSVTLLVPAVVTLKNGTEIGITTKLTVKVVPGSGIVYIATNPIAGTDTEATARVAFLVASYLAGVNPYKFNVYISFNTSSLMIEGPSAGVAMTVAILAALRGDHLRKDVIATGMVNPDGTVGPVGGLLAKLEAAAKSGAKYFLIPEGQRYVYVTKVIRKQVGIVVITKETRVPVDLYKVGEKLGVKVIQVSTIREAYWYFTGKRLPAYHISGISLPLCLAQHLKNLTINYINASIKNIESTQKLTKLLPASEAKYIDELISYTRGLINSSKSYIKENLTYVAASKAFNAAILSSYTLYAAEAFAGIDPGQIVNETLENALKVINETEEILPFTPKNYEELEIIVAASTRVEMAKEAVNEARRLLSENVILDNSITGEWGALHEAAYAYWRAVSARDWAQTLRCFNHGRPLSFSLLRSVSGFALYYANSVVSYATSLLKEVGVSSDFLNTATNDLNKAYDLFYKGEIYASIGYSLEAISYGIISIDSTFVSNISTIVKAAKLEAYDALARLQSKGLSPPLSLSYLEFAKVEKDPINKLYFYELSSSYMKLLYYASGFSQGMSQTPTSTQTVTQTNTTKTSENITTKTYTAVTRALSSSYIAEAFLLLILGLVIGLIIGRMSKE